MLCKRVGLDPSKPYKDKRGEQKKHWGVYVKGFMCCQDSYFVGVQHVTVSVNHGPMFCPSAADTEMGDTNVEWLGIRVVPLLWIPAHATS